MIHIDHVTFAYPSGQVVFDGFDWQLETGQPWAVLGPSGCGKTTLLYLLAGMLAPKTGSVVVDGIPLKRPRPQTGLVLQDYGLLPWANVDENISLGLRIRRFYGPDGLHSPSLLPQNINIGFWIKRLGLSGLEKKYPAQLSGGQRQRVAIARTLVLQPDLLLMDEPFSSLDAPTRRGLEDLTLSLWREQQFTLVVVTHAIEEAAILGKNILVLGRPTTPAIILSNPAFDQPDARDRQDFHAICKALRLMIESSLPGEVGV